MSTDPNTLIASAITRADATAAAAQDAARVALSTFFFPGGTEYVATVPALRGTPPAYTGSMNIVSDVRASFADALAEFDPVMQAALADYLARFYPQAIANAADDWITDAILNGGTGIPAAIEAQIWERARSQEARESVRMEREVVDGFAAKGWSLPSGALAAQMLAVQQSAADKASTLSRERAIAAAELEQKNIQFAIEQGNAVRIGVLSALSAYIKAWMSPIENALEKAKILADAQQRMWSSSADYYRAMIAEASMGIDVQRINAASRDSVMSSQNSTLQASVNQRVSTAAGIANVLGQMAASMSGSTISMAGANDLRVGSITA